MANINTPETIQDLPLAIVGQMITLSTSGFGVVVALAWNELIRNVIDTYVKPYLGQGSGVVSLLIYAVGMTVLAVLVTMQLSKIQKNLELLQEKARERVGRRKQDKAR